MPRRLATILLATLAMLGGALGLVGCSSSEDAATEGQATTQEAASDAASDAALVGTWENSSGTQTYFSAITFASGGTGTGVDIDGTEAAMTWSQEGDTLTVEVEYDGMRDTTSGGFAWVEEGVSFSWDADGTFTKVE